MNIRIPTLLLSSVLALAAGTPAQALDPSGASASGYAYGSFAIGCTTCPHYEIYLSGDPAPQVGGPGFASAAFDYTGGPTGSSAPNPGDYTLGGDVSMAAWAGFQGPLATPELRARAAAHNVPVFLTADLDQNVGVDYYGVSATAETVQRYTYTGTGSTTYTFTFRVDGQVTDERSSVFGAASFYGESQEINLAFGSVFVEGQGLELHPAPVAFDRTFDLTMTFNEGDSYHMRAWLSAGVTGMYATGSPFADAYNTMLVTGITGDVSLLSVTPVPEPASGLLLVAGLGLVGVMLRRQARARP